MCEKLLTSWMSRNGFCIPRIAKVRLKNEEQPSKVPATTPELQVTSPTRGATPCDIEESVLIRYLLLFGDSELYEEERNGYMRSVSVGEFIIRELAEDDLELLNPCSVRCNRNISVNMNRLRLSRLGILFLTRI